MSRVEDLLRKGSGVTLSDLRDGTNIPQPLDTVLDGRYEIQTFRLQELKLLDPNRIMDIRIKRSSDTNP